MAILVLRSSYSEFFNTCLETQLSCSKGCAGKTLLPIPSACGKQLMSRKTKDTTGISLRLAGQKPDILPSNGINLENKAINKVDLTCLFVFQAD